MAHTLKFHGGFEEEELVRWSASSGGVVEKTIVSYGRAAWRWAVTAATGNVVGNMDLTTAGAWDSSNTNHHCWVSFHLYIVTLPAATKYYYLANFSDEASVRCHLRLTETGGIELSRETTYETGTGTLATGTWYVVSVYSGPSAYPQVIIRNRDTGATVASHTLSLIQGSGTGCRDFRVGPATTSTGDCIFDNVVMESAASVSNIADPVGLLTTQYACGLLPPVAAGTYDAFTGTYADLDDYPNDGATTTRNLAGALGAFTQVMAPCSSLATQVGTVHSVMYWELHDAANGTVNNAALRLRTSSTNTDSATYQPGTGDNYAAPRQLLKTTDPATSSAWTLSAVDSAEVGVVRANSGSYTLLVTQIGLEVLYTITARERKRRVHYVLDAADPENRIFDDQGREIDYSKVRANRWMRIMSRSPITAGLKDSYAEREDMVYLESVRYSQTPRGASLSIQTAPDNFVELLVGRIATSGGQV